MHNFTSVIIDDEEDAREVTALLLNEFFPNVELTAKISSVSEATRLIPALNPDIVFLDIEMGDGTGFDLLERLPNFIGMVIFITAFDNYAIKAIKTSAADYILKPLNRDEFRQAVNKTLGKLERINFTKTNIIPIAEHYTEVRKIAIPNLTGYNFIDVNTIVRCEADGNYSAVYFTQTTKILVSKNLSHFETDLKKFGFVRIHHKHLINLNHIVHYSKGKNGGYITMSDGSELEVSARKKPLLLKIFTQGV